MKYLLASILGLSLMATPVVAQQPKMEVKELDKSKLSVVFHGATWCDYCNKMRPHFDNEKVVKALESYKVNKVGTKETNPLYGKHWFYIDVDRDPEWSVKYKIIEIPVILILDSENRIVKRYSGYVDAGQVAKILEQKMEVSYNENGQPVEEVSVLGVVMVVKWVVIIIARILLQLLG